jgi:hypothetical protein
MFAWADPIEEIPPSRSRIGLGSVLISEFEGGGSAEEQF